MKGTESSFALDGGAGIVSLAQDVLGIASDLKREVFAGRSEPGEPGETGSSGTEKLCAFGVQVSLVSCDFGPIESGVSFEFVGSAAAKRRLRI